ncbi:hypothetical protein BC829DRAFT_210412 [Chytridium lagenaria]|nr:hypothetical protein BC829DRAFT_210412 [Chytridium lagenaria]
MYLRVLPFLWGLWARVGRGISLNSFVDTLQHASLRKSLSFLTTRCLSFFFITVPHSHSFFKVNTRPKKDSTKIQGWDSPDLRFRETDMDIDTEHGGDARMRRVRERPSMMEILQRRFKALTVVQGVDVGDGGDRRPEVRGRREETGLKGVEKEKRLNEQQRSR